MAIVQDILKIAASQVGYKEGSGNSNKYGKEYGMNNVSWCVQWVWWVFQQANASHLFYDGKKVASCTKVREWAKKAGLIVEVPRTGDLVIFDWNKDGVTDHIGIIEKVSGSTLYTIEGNTGDGNASDGDGVYRRKRSTIDKICYIRPDYGETETGDKYVYTKPVVYLPQLSRGDNNEYVAVLQTMLSAKGYDCGEVDGDMGSKTVVGLKAFQKAENLQQNGKVGVNVWARLFKK